MVTSHVFIFGNKSQTDLASFPFVSPSLVGAYYLNPDARAIFLHNDLLCDGTYYVTGFAKATGGTDGKDPRLKFRYIKSIIDTVAI